MKIYIQWKFRDGPWGGGNQFLKALRKELIRTNCYTENPEESDVILFNSHHHLDEIVKLRRIFQGKIFVHRVDGPMSYRGEEGEKIDRKIFKINQLVADGTVFQSEWSRSESRKQGIKQNNYEAVIHNAPDPEIFYPKNNFQKEPSGKIKLIATSWSPNKGKGFDIYQFLDKNLDFEAFEMTFVGPRAKKIKNIQVVEPVPSTKLAACLREHDIYLFASKLEACSNCLLEALHCNLPAVVRNSSSNPEVLGKGGEVFDGKNDVLKKIDLVAEKMSDCIKRISVESIEEIGKKYYAFFEKILNEVKFGENKIKELSFIESLDLRVFSRFI